MEAWFVLKLVFSLLMFKCVSRYSFSSQLPALAAGERDVSAEWNSAALACIQCKHMAGVLQQMPPSFPWPSCDTSKRTAGVHRQWTTSGTLLMCHCLQCNQICPRFVAKPILMSFLTGLSLDISFPWTVAVTNLAFLSWMLSAELLTAAPAHVDKRACDTISRKVHKVAGSKWCHKPENVWSSFLHFELINFSVTLATCSPLLNFWARIFIFFFFFKRGGGGGGRELKSVVFFLAVDLNAAYFKKHNVFKCSSGWSHCNKGLGYDASMETSSSSWLSPCLWKNSSWWLSRVNCLQIW